ncbi:GntR family transcriptional regulator [Companilactobacillus jidongensis]|uniref:GntR family transcriptional regulator n=1 Tax=Companilactobacillus jidongensis TaxID=2486006 RepID=UPI000F79DD09|nr:GntR family transcriptional regulator [Companilactobacillus jidongensis]
MEPIKQMPTSTRVASLLRKAILSGEYSGDEELSLTKISDQLGVSRTPVREAFQQLSSEGLITLRMNKGAIVKSIDKKFIIDHFEVRILLECEAVKRAVKNNMDVSDLLIREKELQKQSNVAKIEDYIQANQDIHRSIWKAADNQKLFQLCEELWNGSSTNNVYPAIEHHLKSVDEHIELLTAIQNGEASKASNIMKKHLTRSMNNLIDNFDNQSD